MRDPLDDQLDETFRALQAHNAAARESSSRRRIGDGRLGRRVLLVTLALITLGAGAVFGALVSGAIDLSSGGTKTPAAARKPAPATPAQRKPPITAKPASVTPATTTAPAATAPATTAATTTTAKKQTTTKKKKTTTASANHAAMPPLLHLQLRAARGDSWAMVRVGDRTGPVVYSGIVRKGTSATVAARGKLWARFGAVANLDLVLNGKAVRPSHTGTINTLHHGRRAEQRARGLGRRRGLAGARARIDAGGAEQHPGDEHPDDHGLAADDDGARDDHADDDAPEHPGDHRRAAAEAEAQAEDDDGLRAQGHHRQLVPTRKRRWRPRQRPPSVGCAGGRVGLRDRAGL